MQILMVLTSRDRIGDAGPQTGFWLEEFTAAYYELLEAGVEITLASSGGGQPPVDPCSDGKGSRSATVERFKSDRDARTALADTLWLNQVVADDFDAAFYVGGHGAMLDLPEDRNSQVLIAALLADGRPVALVGHGPAALRHAVDSEGRPVLQGRRVTAIANSEEKAMGLTEFLPFLLQDELVRLGGLYSQGPAGVSHVVRDGALITGQNAASAADAARALLDTLRTARS